MNTDEEETTSSEHPFPDKPDPSNNDEFLDDRLVTLRKRYSCERLSDLSARRLGATNPDDEGLSERDLLHREFDELYNRFPDENTDPKMRRALLGEDYQGLAPLTLEQEQRIRNCHRECGRNLDRARQDALEREDFDGTISKFASWLVDFADAVTPIFGARK